jgi:hypothetical protein
MIGLLATLVILAVMAVLALKLTSSPSVPSANPSFPSGPRPTSTTTPASVAHGTQVAACQSEVALLTTAVAAYEAVNSSTPPPGTAWITSNAHGGPFSGAPLAASAAFRVTWTGSAVRVVPAHGESATGVGTPSPPTGCYGA